MLYAKNAEPKEIGGGLLPQKADPRDFKLSKVLGAINLSYLPDEFILEGLRVEDQRETDLCTAYAITSASELQEGVELSPYYQFAKTKQIEGNPDSWGATLRGACKSAVQYGSLEEKDMPADKTGDPKDFRDFRTWSLQSDMLARKHRKESFFEVDKGSYDSLFDAIKAAIWEHKITKKVVKVGVKWRNEWTSALGGFIPLFYGEYGFGHAFVIKGWKKTQEEEYLVAHLSNGEDIGDKGIFYFPREVVEREFSPRYGLYMFKDMPAAEYKKKNWGWRERLYNFFAKIFS